MVGFTTFTLITNQSHNISTQTEKIHVEIVQAIVLRVPGLDPERLQERRRSQQVGSKYFPGKQKLKIKGILIRNNLPIYFYYYRSTWKGAKWLLR